MIKSSKIISLLVLCAVIYSTSVVAVASDEKISFKRWGSKDRFATNLIIVNENWQKSKYIIIVNGDEFPDALCAAPLAKKYDAPIILCSGDTINEQIKSEITKLNPENAIIIGGEGAVSKGIEDNLGTMNIKIERIFGNDRFETSAKVSEIIGFEKGAIVVNGYSYADALSACAISNCFDMPIVLVEDDNIPESIGKIIKDKNLKNSFIFGGSGVVSDKVLNLLPNCERVGGENRYDTNVKIVDKFKKDLDFSKIFITEGENFPDALSISSVAAKSKNPIILMSEYGSFETKDYVKAQNVNMQSIVLVGGEKVIPDTILEKKVPEVKVPEINVEGLVKPSIVYANLNKEYSEIPVGSKVEIIRDYDNGKKYSINYNNKEYVVTSSYLNIYSDPVTNPVKMTKDQMEKYVNMKDFYSDTAYFVWVDLDRQRINVFTGKTKEWKLIMEIDCASGVNRTPTIRGTFYIGDRGQDFFDKYGYGARNWVRISEFYLFHSVIVDRNYNIVDGNLGKRLSHGCIRMSVENSKWFHDYIPQNTKIWIW